MSVVSTNTHNPAERQGRLLRSVSIAVSRGGRRKYGRSISKDRLVTIEKTLIRGVSRIWALGHHLDDVAQIGAEHVQALLRNLQEEGYSDSTVRYYLAAFRQLGRWCNKECLVAFKYPL